MYGLEKVRKEISGIRVSEVIEIREKLSNSVQLSRQEPEKQEEPERVVGASLGMGVGGENVACSGLFCQNVTLT